MADNVIFLERNPTLPFTGKLNQGVLAGTRLTVTGICHPQCDRFEINLKEPNKKDNKEDKKAGYALHFNPRFGAGHTVMNSRVEGKWGSEEKFTWETLSKGQEFNVYITVLGTGYEIQVNHERTYLYRHRLVDLTKLTQITIAGSGLEVLQVKVELF